MRDTFKIVLEYQDACGGGYWQWRVISPWNFTSAGRNDSMRAAVRSAKRAMRKLDNVRSMTVDSGNPPSTDA